MYLNISVRITIGERLELNTVKSVEIQSTLEKISNKATVELPREFKDAKGKRLLDYIKTGDTIRIELGYNGELKTEFEGYIAHIGAEIPTVLECEDEMYKLKRTKKFNHTFANTKLKEVLQFIAPGYEIDCVDMSLGKFMIENCTAFEVLEDLKKYGIRCNFYGKKLHAGMMVDFKTPDKHKFVFGKNIRKSSDLKYVTKDKKECKITAISIQAGTSKKVTYEFGTPVNGERTLHMPLNLSKNELKEQAEKYYHSVVFDGYDGTLDGWCIPRTKPGDTLQLIDPQYPDEKRDGNFLIESVTIKANANDGIKRENKISMKL
ncbi:hypothetical protein [Riemerella columbipharyngis]|uniref:Phage protein D n=1 Tax=Riemerella columbipharyngis TaxID=1071918 RepID=A0A1G7FK72_9FLAO|nr:hypothetical protein [Riemerella columbipharyngis]SDE76015.1 hypothetical protein SAMN05421544_12326 [Riemerella columbipharyngis]